MIQNMRYQTLLSLALVLVATREAVGLRMNTPPEFSRTVKKMSANLGKDFAVVSGGDNKDTINLLCIGDSITLGHSVSKPYPALLFDKLNNLDSSKNYSIDNQGAHATTMLTMKPGTECSRPVDGARSYWDDEHFGMAMSSKPDLVTVALGINDATVKAHGGCDDAGNWEKRYEDDYVEMIQQLQKLISYHNTHPDIYLMTPQPSTLEHLTPFNGAFLPILQRVQERTGVKGVIDVYAAFADGSWHAWDGLHPGEEVHNKVADIIVDRIKADYNVEGNKEWMTSLVGQKINNLMSKALKKRKQKI